MMFFSKYDTKLSEWLKSRNSTLLLKKDRGGGTWFYEARPNIAHTFLKDKTKKIEIFLVNSRKTENRSQNRGQTQVWPVWPVPPPLSVCKYSAVRMKFNSNNVSFNFSGSTETIEKIQYTIEKPYKMVTKNAGKNLKFSTFVRFLGQFSEN